MRVLIVGGRRLHREGLVHALVENHAVTHASGWESELGERPTDVALIDMTARQAVLLVEHVARRLPDAALIVHSGPEGERDLVRCVEAGVTCFVPAEGSLADVHAALDSAAAGRAYCSAEIAATLLGRLRDVGRMTSTNETRLTSRELEIIRLIEGGLTNKEIARELSIALPTVKNHVHHILEKLGVSRRADAPAKLWAETGSLPRENEAQT